MTLLVHVFFEDGREGVRIYGTNHVIRKEDVSEVDWSIYMHLLQHQVFNAIDRSWA